MENLTLVTLIQELGRVAPGLGVGRITQHHRNGFMFQTRGSKVPALKFSLDSRCPAIYFSGVRPPVEIVTTDFLMVLRKHPMSAEEPDRA